MAFSSSNTSVATLDYGDVTVLDGATSGLWAFWLNVPAWGEAWQNVIQKNDYPTSSGGYAFQRSYIYDTLVFTAFGGGTYTFLPVKEGFVQTQGWHHVAVRATASGGEAGLFSYWDGAYTGLTDASVRNPLGNIAQSLLVVPRDNGVQIADLAIWANPSAAETAAIVAQLAQGWSPLQTARKPGFYAPLTRGSHELILGGLPSAPANAAWVPGPRQAQSGMGVAPPIEIGLPVSVITPPLTWLMAPADVVCRPVDVLASGVLPGRRLGVN